MKITYTDFGEILAWVVAGVLYISSIIDFQTFILFVLLKFTLKVSWR